VHVKLLSVSAVIFLIPVGEKKTNKQQQPTNKYTTTITKMLEKLIYKAQYNPQ